MKDVKQEKYSEYKDSGLESLGKVPIHWVLNKLKHIAKIKTGYTPLTSQSKNFTKEGMVWVKPNDLNEFTPVVNSKEKISEKGIKKSCVIPEKSILVCCIGTIGKFGIAGVNLITNQQINSITFYENINKDYSKYLIFNCVDEFEKRANGNVVRILNTTNQGDIYFAIPPFSEQTVIAQFLDGKSALIDQAINIKEKQIQLLKERRQIVIHQAVTRGLNPKVKMKDSGVEWIGEIPERWEVVRNAVLFSERNESGNESLPILSVSIHTAVSSEEVSGEENVRGKIRIQDKSNYKLVQVGDITFNMMRAWQGAIGAVRIHGMVSPAYVVAKKKRELNSDFIEYLFRTETYIQQISRFSRGITDFRKRLYWNEFKNLCSLLPPIEEQNEIVDFIHRNNDKIEKAINFQKEQIEKLKEYKSTLIKSVVTGKIKVC